MRSVALGIICVALVACADTGSRNDGRSRTNAQFDPSGTVTPIGSTAAVGSKTFGATGTPPTGTPGAIPPGPGGPPGFLVLSSVDPASGTIIGGTDVTLSGEAFRPGARVELDGEPATDVVVVNTNRITLKTPPHAEGLVDVEVILPTNERARLNNAYTYDRSALARVADWGNPSPQEQEILELVNRARQNPVAEGNRLGLDFSQYVAQPPIAHNGFLHQAALSHTLDMPRRAFTGHLNPDGVGPNGRILDTNYDLASRFGSDRAINLTENVGVGFGSEFDTPQKVHDAYMIDANLRTPKHRELILGVGRHAANREAGIGFRTNQPSAQAFRHYETEEFAFTKRDRPFILGTVFNDRSRDGVARVGEGTGGVTVTLRHASGFTLTTQTASAGGYAFEVFVDEPFTISISGQQAAVDVQGNSIKVDLVDGRIRVQQ